MNSRKDRRAIDRAGLSLLEVVIAIAILGGSLVILGELVRTGARQAERARDVSKAQNMALSKLAEYASGIAQPIADGFRPVEFDDDWEYAVESGDVGQGLTAVRVTIRQVTASPRPTEVTMTRWILKPEFGPNQETEEVAAEFERRNSKSTDASASGQTRQSTTAANQGGANAAGAPSGFGAGGAGGFGQGAAGGFGQGGFGQGGAGPQGGRGGQGRGGQGRGGQGQRGGGQGLGGQGRGAGGGPGGFGGTNGGQGFPGGLGPAGTGGAR